MSKELIVSVNGREKKIAIVEDDVVTEFYVERGDENQGIVGNIYKGRVMKVLPGMQSAFVDIGLERDSFLYVSDFFDEDEIEEAVADERKEAARQAVKQERARPSREPARVESVVTPESDDEKEIELQVTALRHIQELSTEPDVEIASEDEINALDAAEGMAEFETGAKAGTAGGSSRQRRHRRLRYADQERAEEAEAVGKSIPLVEAEADAEEEQPGRRRRRRRRRSEGSSETTFSLVDAEEPSEEIAAEAEGEESLDYAPFIIVHHEPLERVTDEDMEAIEGEMLKDALLQERIAERIHEDERRTSLLEVEPTPEVHVGTLQPKITREASFERISDEQSERGERAGKSERTEPDRKTMRTDVIRVWPSEEAETSQIDFLTETREERKPARQIEVDTADDDVVDRLADDIGKKVEMEHLAPLTGGTENGEMSAAGDESYSVEELDEGYPDDDLKDASAGVKQRPRRGEFATRRGGRGRRRSFRQRPSTAEAVPEVEETNGGQAEEQNSAVASPSFSRTTERFQRPAISELLREGQEIIVQIAKEPIGQKGARITSHIALPGRYIVYMPTVEHIGVSRKIGTDEERQRLKRTLHQLRAEAGMGGGFIVRTAANGCTLEELREDMQYLIRTWTDIRRRAERVKAPAIAHRDLDLVQRILRDQLSSDFNAIRVDSEFEYERIVDFVNRFAPKLVSRVKLYTKDTPILEHYAVQAEIDKAVKPRVWLKSGGYIVINQTEALVAIDVNTGKFVGKSNRLEDTIVKTNLEASKEIVRQIRLRDLGGIIVLDFIDMEERRNRQKVMQALELELRSDRSPSKILQFNDFGLVAITRKRVKQSLERTLCTPCYYCGGGGMIKSSQTVCYEILSEARRVSKDIDSHNEVILRVNPEVAKTLRGTERDIMVEIEAYLGGVVTIKSDPTVHQEQFDIAIA
ncbi:MAG: Rne/Rng family ribonuclease [Acidobacteria bacterium]|nr:Rne/Rng family ribonuclease [Acidobacteriota bacterium]